MLRSTIVAALVGLPHVWGYAKYMALIPNGDNVPDTVNVGHLDPAGQTGLNDFGKAFATAGDAWTTSLCQEDTDGDGYTNGQELGDPCCTWTTSNTADLVTDGVSHPSDATKIPTSATLLAGCSSSAATNSSGSTGDSVGDVVGTVAPAGESSGMPPDDDEDDSSESAVLTSGAARTTAVSSVVLVVAAALAF